MNAPFIFSSGIIVVIIFLIGILYTFKEFSVMNRNPSEFRENKKEQPAEVADKEE